MVIVVIKWCLRELPQWLISAPKRKRKETAIGNQILSSGYQTQNIRLSILIISHRYSREQRNASRFIYCDCKCSQTRSSVFTGEVFKAPYLNSFSWYPQYSVDVPHFFFDSQGEFKHLGLLLIPSTYRGGYRFCDSAVSLLDFENRTARMCKKSETHCTYRRYSINSFCLEPLKGRGLKQSRRFVSSRGDQKPSQRKKRNCVVGFANLVT